MAAKTKTASKAVTTTTKPKTKAPATVKAGSNDLVLPEYMRGHEHAGKENIGKDDLEIPRLKLMQGLSPELKERNDLRQGHFYHTANELGLESGFRAVPIYMDKRYILWRPRGEGGGILARADDGVHWDPPNKTFTVTLDKKDGGIKVEWRTAKTVKQSGLAEWGSLNPKDPDSAPAATLMYSYVLAFPDHPDLVPAVLTFQRTSIRAGRRFNTKLRTIKAPMYGLVFNFNSVLETNQQGDDYYTISASGAGFVEDEEQFMEYQALHEGFKEAGLQIRDIEGAQDEGDMNGSNDGPEDAPAY